MNNEESAWQTLQLGKCFVFPDDIVEVLDQFFLEKNFLTLVQISIAAKQISSTEYIVCPFQVFN
jgi:hypothetical protein